MLKECLDIFLKEYGGELEKVITDNETLEEGLYIIVDEDGEIMEESQEVFKKKKKKSDGETQDNSENIPIEIKSLNYLSKILEMNKAIHPKKKISSNNYLTFFVKKEAVNPETPEKKRLTPDMIDEYFSILKNYDETLNKNQKGIYNSYRKEESYNRNQEIERNKEWVKSNIFKLRETFDGYIDNKGYIKIFFVASDDTFDDEDEYKEVLDKYRIESSKYFYPNIFLDKSKIVKVSEGYRGPLNNNITLNEKKPFLKNLTRKVKIPNTVDIEEALNYKRFYDYLVGQCNQGNKHLYFYNEMAVDDGRIDARKEPPNEVISGYYLRIEKDMTNAVVVDFDTLSGKKSAEIAPFKLKNFTGLELGSKDSLEKIREEYNKDMSKRGSIYSLIDRRIYNNNLSIAINQDSPDFKNMSVNMKHALEIMKVPMIEWSFKLKDDEKFIKAFKESTDMIIHEAIKNSEGFKAKNILNIQMSIINWMKGENELKSKIDDMVFSLKQKIDMKDENPKIESDVEFSYALGQTIYYLLSKSKAGDPRMSLVNQYLRLNHSSRILEEVTKLFVKYNNEIGLKGDNRIKNMLSMLYSYNEDAEENVKIDKNMLIFGMVSQNMAFSKKEKVGKETEELKNDEE